MKAFDFNPELRWLFCMTHPDDEISVGGFLFELHRAGAEVHICWTHSTPVRARESRVALDYLHPDRLRFFEAEDGRVVDDLSGLVPKFRELMERVQPDRVVCGAFEQGHLDHDATNWLVNATFPGPVLEAPFYHTYLTKMPRVGRFADPDGEQILVLSREASGAKLKLARSYPSQRIWWNLIWANLRASATGDGSLRATERLRFQTHFDFLTPNLPEPLRSRVEKSAKWRRWVEALANVQVPLLHESVT